MFIFFLAVSLIFDKGPSVRSLGAGESGMPCASFSLVSCKEKDALFLKTVWLSISSQELRPSALLDTYRLGTVCQTTVARPNEISHFSREAGWTSSTCVVQISAGQPATPYSAPARSTAQSLCPEAGNWREMAAALSLFSSTSNDPKSVGFLWDFVQTCVIFLRGSRNEVAVRVVGGKACRLGCSK